MLQVLLHVIDLIINMHILGDESGTSPYFLPVASVQPKTAQEKGEKGKGWKEGQESQSWLACFCYSTRNGPNVKYLYEIKPQKNSSISLLSLLSFISLPMEKQESTTEYFLVLRYVVIDACFESGFLLFGNQYLWLNRERQRLQRKPCEKQCRLQE